MHRAILLLCLAGTVALSGAARTSTPVAGVAPVKADEKLPAAVDVKAASKAVQGYVDEDDEQSGYGAEERHEHKHHDYYEPKDHHHDEDEDEHKPYHSHKGGYTHKDQEDRPYQEDEYRSSNFGRQIINLEIVRREGAPPAAAAPRIGNITLNDTLIDYGVICRYKKSAYPSAKPESYYGDDTDLVIKHQPIELEQLGSGAARLEVLTEPRPVKIDKQRASQVGTLYGTLSRFSDASSCNPLLTRTTEILYRNVPVYLMLSKLRLPLDASMLTPLLPVLNVAGTAPGANTTQRATSQAASSQQILQGELNGKAQSSTAQEAKVSVAAAGGVASYDEDDTTLCGLTLVAKGSVTLRTSSRLETQTYRGHMETTLLWTNGVVTLPGFVADALGAGASGPQATRNLFSTTVRQQLTSMVYNGVAGAQIFAGIGNSADVSAYLGGTGTATGGTSNFEQNNNTANATAANASLQRGDDIVDNTVNVVNDLGAVLEQYGEVLRSVCKNHKALGFARPGQMRLDVSYAETTDSVDGGSGSGGQGLTVQQIMQVINSWGLPGLAGLTEQQVLMAFFGTTDVSGLTEQDVLDALFGGRP